MQKYEIDEQLACDIAAILIFAIDEIEEYAAEDFPLQTDIDLYNSAKRVQQFLQNRKVVKS